MNVPWSEQARERLSRIPVLIRGQVEKSAQAYASEQGLSEISTEVLEHLRRQAGMSPSDGVPPSER